MLLTVDKSSFLIAGQHTDLSLSALTHVIQVLEGAAGVNSFRQEARHACGEEVKSSGFDSYYVS